MDRLTYADIDNDKYHYRIADSSSRTTFDPNRGIQATDINDKVFPKESIIRTSNGSAIPFPGVTAKALMSQSRVWETDRMDSKLISATSKLMWAMWEAIRRLTKPRYNPRTITLYAIRIPDNSADDILQANACDVLDKTSDPGVKRANWFARSSAEHLYFLRIPLAYIESMQVLTLRVSELNSKNESNELTKPGTSQYPTARVLQDCCTASTIWARCLRVGLQPRSILHKRNQVSRR